MHNSRTSAFSSYNRAFAVALASVVVIAGALIWQCYQHALDTETVLISQTLRGQQIALGAIVKGSSDALLLSRSSAQDWYRIHSSKMPASTPLDTLLRSRTDEGVNLDQPPPPWNEGIVGNLTGPIVSPDASLRRELSMALDLGSTFHAIKLTIPEARWIYYTSARRFIHIYPWTASANFSYHDTLKQEHFYRAAQPTQERPPGVVWSPVYVDEAGQGTMVTASVAVCENDTFRGVIALDLKLDQFNAFVRHWPNSLGTLFIVDQQGQLVAHPNLVQENSSAILPMRAAFPVSIADHAPELLVRSVARFVIADGYYIQNLLLRGTPFRLVYIVSRWELLQEIIGGVLGVGMLLFCLLVVLLVARFIAQRDAIAPAEKLVRYIEDEIHGAAASTIPPVPEVWRPWFQTIREVFNAHARLVTIQQELDVARRMQQSIVPKRFPNRAELQMYACMMAAQEVGGDFYDYFWLDDTKLGIVIADVSGKGVPAALFMAVARTLLRATAPAALDAGSCLAMANDLLCKDNEAVMFVTLFYGLLDIRTGELVYANAGHNAPYIVGPDGSVTQLAATGGTALGVIEGLPYAQHKMMLLQGSTLVLYTDGITETFDAENRPFGEQRLVEHLIRSSASPVRELLETLVEAVRHYGNGAPQPDDITCLAVRFVAPDFLTLLEN